MIENYLSGRGIALEHVNQLFSFDIFNFCRCFPRHDYHIKGFTGRGHGLCLQGPFQLSQEERFIKGMWMIQKNTAKVSNSACYKMRVECGGGDDCTELWGTGVFD